MKRCKDALSLFLCSAANNEIENAFPSKLRLLSYAARNADAYLSFIISLINQ